MAYDSLIYTGTINRIGIDEVIGSLDSIWDALVASDVRYSDDASTKKFPVDGYAGINSYEGTSISSNDVNTVYDLLELGGIEGGNRQLLGRLERKVERFVSHRPGWLEMAKMARRRSAAKADERRCLEQPFLTAHSRVTLKAIPPAIRRYLSLRKASPAEISMASRPNSTSESRWKDYIRYVMDNRTLNDYNYEKKYGFRTLMHYLISQRMENHKSEDLWRAPIYPAPRDERGHDDVHEFP